jgi:hypothetical protein
MLAAESLAGLFDIGFVAAASFVLAIHFFLLSS